MVKSSKKKEEKQPEVTTTTSIVLNVPNKTYYKVRAKADDRKLKTGNKITIHDLMIEQLDKANKK